MNNYLDKVMDSKLSYGGNPENFKGENELMVTITLGEYRSLVETKATKELAIRNSEKDKYERDDENRKLKIENNELKAEMFELKKALDANETNESDEE